MLVGNTRAPIRLTQSLSGIYPDLWSGPTVQYQRFACLGGTLTVLLGSERFLHPTDELIVASDHGEELARRIASNSLPATFNPFFTLSTLSSSAGFGAYDA